MRGAKSNALLFRGANCHPGCPCVALVIDYSLGGTKPSAHRVFGINGWVTLERTDERVSRGSNKQLRKPQSAGVPKTLNAGNSALFFVTSQAPLPNRCPTVP
jgi:hypothetical protein